MKKLLIPFVAAVAFGLCICYAASPAYKSANANGTSTIPAQVLLAPDAYSQIRVVNIVLSTDTNNSYLRFSSGNAAHTQTYTNVSSSGITNRIDSTNGIIIGQAAILVHAGTCYLNTIAGYNQTTNTDVGGGTNIILASGGWGVVTAPGDAIYIMGPTNSYSEPAAASGTTSTLPVNGEAVYVADYSGRPVRIWLSPAFSTNQLNQVIYHYD